MQRCFSMKVVVDANILVSALLKKGLTRQVWFDLTLDLVAPAFIIREFLKHKAELRRRYGGSAEEFGSLAEKIQEAPIKALEIVLSCPHTPGYGLMAGQGTPKATAEITKAVRRKTNS